MSHGGVGAGYLSNANGSFSSDFVRIVFIIAATVCLCYNFFRSWRYLYYKSVLLRVFFFYVFVHKIFHVTSYEVIEFFSGIDALLTLEWFMCSFGYRLIRRRDGTDDVNIEKDKVKFCLKML